MPGAIPEFSEKVADQLASAMRKAIEILQLPTRDELEGIKEKLADLGEIVDELNERCDKLAQ